MSKNIYHIYDKIFKKILTLSSTAVINLINGLFDTSYPTDSIITYNWTEFENNELRRILADTILTINGKYSYHMEAQITEDEDIIFRVFDYGYSHAERSRKFSINVNFGSQSNFIYKVSTFKFLECSLDELNQKKMIILIPFQLLKLKKLMEKERSAENLDALKYLIEHDIIESIEQNLTLNNITPNDARRLKRLTHQLYQHIYSHYEEMEVLNVLTDESLILDIDIIEKRHEDEIAAIKAQKDAEYAKIIAQKDAEIAALKKRIN